MRNILLYSLIILSSFPAFAQPNVMLSEIADPNDVFSCRFVEIFCEGPSPCDMSDVELRGYFNSNTTYNSTSLAGLGTLQPNDIRVIAYSSGNFLTCYGFNADMTGAPNSNGDDNIALATISTNTIFDMFGVIGEDGTGTCHEFEDGKAVRKSTVTSTSATWVESEWTVYSDSGPSGGTVCPDQIVSAQNSTDMDPGVSALPVELLNFEGRYSNKIVELNWQTASEVNNYRFDIQRSVDGYSYKTIGRVKGNDTKATISSYEFKDYNPEIGVSYYRLKQVDYDGAFEYSNVVSIETLYRNTTISPTATYNLVNITTGDDNPTNIYLFDNMGRVVMTENNVIAQTTLDLEALSQGIYYLKIGSEEMEKIVRL